MSPLLPPVGADDEIVLVPWALFVAVAVIAMTYAVVAIWVVFVPEDAVGAVGVPLSAGDASGAREVSVG